VDEAAADADLANAPAVFLAEVLASGRIASAPFDLDNAKRFYAATIKRSPRRWLWRRTECENRPLCFAVSLYNTYHFQYFSMGFTRETMGLYHI